MVNYVSSNCIMISHYHKKISTEDLSKILLFRRPFLYGNVCGLHEDTFCQKLKKIVTKANSTYNCLKCMDPKDSPLKDADKLNMADRTKAIDKMHL